MKIQQDYLTFRFESLNHAHVVTITGKSYRLKDHMKPNDDES